VHAPSGKLRLCGDCRQVRYCSVTCQQADFREHWPKCLELKWRRNKGQQQGQQQGQQEKGLYFP
jgi:hypothetical protein